MSIISKIKSRIGRSRLKAKAVASAVALACAGVAAVATLGGAAAAPVSTPDCNSNAVVWCGVSRAGSTSQQIKQLQNDYNNGDGHNKGYTIRDIYNGFGIWSGSISAMSSDAVIGYVTKSGDVYTGTSTNHTLVATNAYTAGRQYISGSVKKHYGATTYYRRAPSVSFLNPELTALVSMKNGVFQFAVLTSCGNPVSATTVPKKPAPKPNYAISKLVRAGTSGSYASSVSNVKSGSTVQYQITVSSTGQAPAQNVTVHDKLPSGITYKSGTLQKDGATATSTQAGQFFGAGWNVGTINNGSKDVFTFSAQAGAASATSSSCKPANDLTNTSTAVATGLSPISSSAKVSIICTPPPPPPPVSGTLVCDSLTLTPGQQDMTTGAMQFTLTAKAHAVGNAKITHYNFDFGDGQNSGDITSSSTTHTYDLTASGKTASVTVKGIDTAANKPITAPHNNACTATVSIPPLPKPGKPDYSILKQVSASENGSYSAALPSPVPSNTTVYFRVTVSSTGAVPVSNATVHDTLPADMTYNSGTLQLDGQPVQGTDATNFFTTTGITIPSIPNGNKVQFEFSAQAGSVSADDANCKTESLTNVGYVSAPTLPTQNSSASVSITCTTPPTTPPPVTPTPPAQMPNTGAGNTIGLFMGVVVAGTIGFRFFLSRRLKAAEAAQNTTD